MGSVPYPAISVAPFREPRTGTGVPRIAAVEDVGNLLQRVVSWETACAEAFVRAEPQYPLQQLVPPLRRETQVANLRPGAEAGVGEGDQLRRCVVARLAQLIGEALQLAIKVVHAGIPVIAGRRLLTPTQRGQAFVLPRITSESRNPS
ncbi:protein of unknown function (plasmid) [Cupriavidus taiwanensis]|uniref:Uncharacterized protein n=1 Tax=Cupriavidus taiwanensis TaxID=164546 RepID=A0A375IUE5_9BURK|nr:protein of unknown function [Cupriavidus taiwanensis]